ncbi:MAG: HAD family phosphatase [Muribaculaceae bacterium]|nr:HAD family phosphatase [Muribaculaceae bacterium]MBQ9073683.1 HAD family phosphatase [Muribaculaceae bacterium]
MIRNLLFDLGGVIMDIKRKNCEAAFRQLGMDCIGDFLGDYGQKGPFLKLEEGAIDETTFRQQIRKYIPHDVTDDEIDHAFCQFLVGIPTERLIALRKLRSKYNLYVLSNTNSIMWNSRIAEEFRKEGLTVDDYFDGIVTSFEAKCVKPDIRIFNIVAEQCNIKPEDTIFFDDSLSNVQAAASLGFKTIHVAPGKEFYDLIND